MDPAKMKVVDLRNELSALGLDTKGNKPALVERLKKALEAKTGNSVPDTSILDTSTEEVPEEMPTPGPRTRRRSSSTKAALPSTPYKTGAAERHDEEPVIQEEKVESEPEPVPEPVPAPEIKQEPEVPEPVPEPEKVDSESQDSEDKKDDESPQEEPPKQSVDVDMTENSNDATRDDSGEKQNDGEEKPDEDKPANGDVEIKKEREISEEEEFRLFHEKLVQREQERKQKEKELAEAEKERLEKLQQENPVKYRREMRKKEKKSRWSNFYQNVAIANEVIIKGLQETKKEEPKRLLRSPSPQHPEPDGEDNAVTLSWYDSDLHQYIDVSSLCEVMPLNEGGFSQSWAGARATYGVTKGKVLYEVRIGATLTATEESTSAIRIGWSTINSSLHLGLSPMSYGYESTGRVCNNGEFRDFGETFKEKDVIGAYLDMDAEPATISYTLNGKDLGVAYTVENCDLQDQALFPHILTKNICYSVNFGRDKYSMLTKTKLVKNKYQVPIAEVLEEVKRRDAEEAKRKAEAEARRKAAFLEREKQREERRKRRQEERRQRSKSAGEDKSKESGGEERTTEDQNKEKTTEDQNKEKTTEDQNKENGAADEADKKDEQENQKEGDVAAMETEATPPDQPAASTEKEVEIKQEPMEQDGQTEKAQQEQTPVPEVTEQQVKDGIKLDPRIKFVTRFSVSEEIDGEEIFPIKGYLYIGQIPLDNLVAGPRKPASDSEAEVLLMVGLPGSGKTTWALKHVAENPEKRYNILSTGALLDTMRVDCKPYRDTYTGKWENCIAKCAKCVVKLLDIAKTKRRNYILDQTNVYQSAQRRKLREFGNFKRICVVVVPNDEEYKRRLANRDTKDAKEVPDNAINDMKANFMLPEKGSFVDDVIYTELPLEEAKAVVDQYYKEAKSAGGVRERRATSPGGGAPPPYKRPKQGPPSVTSSGGGGSSSGGGGGGARGNRWGPPQRSGGGGGGGGGSRWGGRDERGGGGGDRWGNDRRDNRGRDYMGGGGRDHMAGGALGGRGDHMGGGGGMGLGGGGGGRDYMGGRGGRHERGAGGGGPRAPPGVGGGAPNQLSTGEWKRGAAAAKTNDYRTQKIPGVGAAGGSNKDTSNQLQSSTGQGQGQNWGNWTGQNWNNWNNQGWGNWNNWSGANNGWGGWGNTGGGTNSTGGANNPPGGGGGNKAGGGGGGGGGQQQPASQWANNYTAQQWYQWQQWQQQQQGWPGYQSTGGGAQPTAEQQQQMWAQYYQNYQQAATGATGGNVNSQDK